MTKKSNDKKKKTFSVTKTLNICNTYFKILSPGLAVAQNITVPVINRITEVI